MLKKIMFLGMTVVMMLCVGCGKPENEEVKVDTLKKAAYELEVETNELVNSVYDIYDETFKEIYGDEFNMNELEIVDDCYVSYNGKQVSVEYVEELAYNSMTIH